MKIVHVSTNDLHGGAAIAATRLHKALLNYGLNSQMVVQRKDSDLHTIIGPANNFEKIQSILNRHIDSLPLKLRRIEPSSYFSTGFISLSSTIEKINLLKPDIIHLHWINAGMISINDLKMLNAPVVWTLHDNWLVTGGCHISSDCNKFELECNKCPVLKSKSYYDLSTHYFRKKKKVMSNTNISRFITLSTWLTKMASRSAILNERRESIIHLPNLIDTQIFKPENKFVARRILNLPQEKKLIAFGALNPLQDQNKGFSLLEKAIAHINSNYELVVFGSSQGNYNLNHNIHFLGPIRDEFTLAILYSSVDVVVVPSRQENLSNVIMESLACGTPVVAFNVGGNEDLIEHKVNGYLATAFDTDDLAEGINYFAKLEAYGDVKENCRNSILSKFDSKKILPKYIDLYRKVISQT